MSRKLLLLTAMLLVVVLAATSCGVFRKKSTEVPPAQTSAPMMNEQETEEIPIRETLVYYQDDAGYLVPVMRRIPWEEGIAKATLRMMMNNEEQQPDLIAMGLNALLPEGAEVLGMNIVDGVARIDFNHAVLNAPDALAESNMMQGIVMTLAEFSTIETVQFIFEGKILEQMPFGTRVKDPIAPGNVNLEMAAEGAQGAKVTVFFQSTSPSAYAYLIPVTRITGSMHGSLETALRELLAGPKEPLNMTIDIPQGTQLLGIQMDQGITYINFSSEFNALANSAESEAMVFKAILMTARQFPEVTQVQILVEGKNYAGSLPNTAPVFANEY